MTAMEEEETEKLVESFYNYLKQEKGLSEETASAHAHHIRFFAVHYLIGYAGKNLLEVTDRDIDDYLGNWYIRKVWGGGKSEVRPILTAFKKFYKFLHECGSVDKDQSCANIRCTFFRIARSINLLILGIISSTVSPINKAPSL